MIHTVFDVPRKLNVTLLRNAGTKFESVFSSKGVGEPPLTLATAVVCAIRGAVASYRRDQGAEAGDWRMEIPMTSERIRMACQDDIITYVTEHVTTPDDGALLDLFKM